MKSGQRGTSASDVEVTNVSGHGFRSSGPPDAAAPPSAGEEHEPASSAQPEAVSGAARRLHQAQQRVLARILEGMEAAGPASYKKMDHWAWYVWPTSKVGRSDAEKTAVETVADAAWVLSHAETRATWTAVLRFCAAAVEAQGRDAFPSIDHWRIDFFTAEWASAELAPALQPHSEFAAAFGKFAQAWRGTPPL